MYIFLTRSFLEINFFFRSSFFGNENDDQVHCMYYFGTQIISIKQMFYSSAPSHMRTSPLIEN